MLFVIHLFAVINRVSSFLTAPSVLSPRNSSSICTIWMDKQEGKDRDEEGDGCPFCWHSDPAGLCGGSGCLMSSSYPRELTPLLPPGAPNMRIKNCSHSLTITCVAFTMHSGRSNENTIFLKQSHTHQLQCLAEVFRPYKLPHFVTSQTQTFKYFMFGFVLQTKLHTTKIKM